MRLPLAVGLFLMTTWLALAVPALAQDDDPPTIPFEGFEVFRFLLFQKGFESVPSWEALGRSDPRKTLLLYLGRAEKKEPHVDFNRFVAGGGNLLYANDYRDFSNLNLPPWNASVSGRKFQQPEGGYLDNPDCPYFPASILPIHPLFRGMFRGLATNSPSYFEPTKTDLPVSLRLPLAPPPKDVADAFARIFQGGAKGPTYLLASGSEADVNGRCLFLAGHGVFVNGMLLQSDADNFMFANNAFRWLRETETDGAFRKVCLVIDGEVIPKFDVSLKANIQIPSPTTEVINRLLAGLEREDFFQRLLHENVADTILWRICATIATLALCFYGLKRLAAVRFLQDTRVPLTVGPTTEIPELGPEIDQHLISLRIAPNLALPARDLARRWFQLHLSLAPDWWDTAVAELPVNVQIHGWWPNSRLRRQATWLWSIAQGMPTVTRSEFLALRKFLADLDRAHAAKKVSFLVGS